MMYPYGVMPRDYQLDAMKRIYEVKRIGLFMQMGTGKTKIVLDFAGNLLWRKKISRVLVICPLSVIPVWLDEIEKNCPWVSVDTARPGIAPDWNSQFILTNYAHISPRRMDGKTNKKTLESFLKWKPDVVVVDESHHIKRHSTRISKACAKLGAVCEYAICMTGTPIGNRPLDLWSQFRFLKPDLLEEKWDAFRYHYGVWGGWQGRQLLKCQDLDTLSRIIKPYVIVQKKIGLPEKNYIPYRIDMKPEIRGLYNQLEEEFLVSVDGTEIFTPIVLTKLIKLSQITGGFIRNNEGNDIALHTAKLDALKEILTDLREQGTTHVVVFARFLWEIRAIAMNCDKPVYCLTGGISVDKRRQMVDRFIKRGGVLVCQTAIGAEGLNLQAANYSIFYSVDYSYINFVQAQDRIHRIGQTKPCFYYLLRCKGTVDTAIYRLLMKKKDVAENFQELIKEMRNEANNPRSS